jgi:hypothetical protein
VLWILYLRCNSQRFIFFVTYKRALYDKVFVTGKPYLAKLIGFIRKLQRKWRVVNTIPEALFRMLCFLCNLQMAHKQEFLNNTLLEKLASDKCFSILGSFISYEENKVLWILPLGPYSQHFVFFKTYKWAIWARVLHCTTLEGLVRDKHSSLFCPFQVMKNMTVPGLFTMQYTVRFVNIVQKFNNYIVISKDHFTVIWQTSYNHHSNNCTVI